MRHEAKKYLYDIKRAASLLREFTSDKLFYDTRYLDPPRQDAERHEHST